MPKWAEVEDTPVTLIKKGDIVIMDRTEWEVTSTHPSNDGSYIYAKWVGGEQPYQKIEEFFFYNYRIRRVRRRLPDCDPCYDSDCECIWDQHNVT